MNDKLVWLSDVLESANRHRMYASANRESVNSFVGFIKEIGSIPAVDAVEVVHADWVCRFIAGHVEIRCSNCGEHHPPAYISSLYCPNCGARMDGEVEHNAAD